MTKETTNDELARMVAEGFKETNERMVQGFERVDERFKQVDDRLDHIDARLGKIESDVSDIRKHFVYRYEFEDLMGRVKYLEEKMGIDSGK